MYSQKIMHATRSLNILFYTVTKETFVLECIYTYIHMYSLLHGYTHRYTYFTESAMQLKT